MTLHEAARTLRESFYGVAVVHPYIQSIGVGADRIRVYLTRAPRSHERAIPAEWEGWPVESWVIGRISIGPP